MTFSPYEEAQDQISQRTLEPIKALKAAGIAGSSLLGGSSIINRLLPLLSQHVPEATAKKAIDKVSPHLGKFVDSATNFGYDFYSVRDFLRAKAAEAQEEKSKNKPHEGNIIKQYSPQLHEFIIGEIQKGRSPLEAAALASLHGNFKPAIKKLTEDHQSPFSAIIESTYGSSQKAQARAQQNVPQQNAPQQNAAQQSNQGKAELLQTMQQITNALRQMRGNG